MRIQGILMQLSVAALLAVALATFLASSTLAHADIYEGSTVTGTIVSFGGRLGSRSGNFRLIIRNYTSRAEVERLNDSLRSGQDSLLNAVSGMSAGQIQIGNGVGVPANVIFVEPAENVKLKSRSSINVTSVFLSCAMERVQRTTSLVMRNYSSAATATVRERSSARRKSGCETVTPGKLKTLESIRRV